MALRRTLLFFFTNTVTRVQNIVRETDSVECDSMILERWANGYAWTISFFFSISQQLEEGDSQESLGVLYVCFVPSWIHMKTAVEMRQRDMFIMNWSWLPSLQYTTWINDLLFVPWNELAKNRWMLWNQQGDIVQAQTATSNWITDLYSNVWRGLDWYY